MDLSLSYFHDLAFLATHKKNALLQCILFRAKPIREFSLYDTLRQFSHLKLETMSMVNQPESVEVTEGDSYQVVLTNA